MVQDGSLKFTEDVLVGLDSAPRGLKRLLMGENTGKIII